MLHQQPTDVRGLAAFHISYFSFYNSNMYEPVTIMYMQEAQSARGNVMKE